MLLAGHNPITNGGEARMILLENGYVQDGLKALLFFIPLAYLILRKKQLNLRYYYLFFTGLLLLFLGNLLDFIDEFKCWQTAGITRTMMLWQDFCEDIVGFSLGFAILLIAIYKEWIGRRSRPAG